MVKRGIPPAARSAKNREITRYVTIKALLHRIASLAAPGAGHLAVGDFMVGFPVLMVWAVCAGTVITVHYLAPMLVAGEPLGPMFRNWFGGVAFLTYLVAQAVKPKAPVVAPVQRRVAKVDEEA